MDQSSAAAEHPAFRLSGQYRAGCRAGGHNVLWGGERRGEFSRSGRLPGNPVGLRRLLCDRARTGLGGGRSCGPEARSRGVASRMSPNRRPYRWESSVLAAAMLAAAAAAWVMTPTAARVARPTLAPLVPAQLGAR